LWCPAAAQTRPQTAAPPVLTDLDGTIESLVRTVDPSVVQIFTSGLATSEGVVTGQPIWSPRFEPVALASSWTPLDL
jgi:hypothetical protein